MRIDIDDKLIAQLNNIRGEKSLNEVINESLRLMITIKNQKNILKLIGKIELDDEAYKL